MIKREKFELFLSAIPPVFKSMLTKSEISTIADCVVEETFQKGHVIIQENEEGEKKKRLPLLHKCPQLFVFYLFQNDLVSFC